MHEEYSPNFSPAEANMDVMHVQESDKDVVNNSDEDSIHSTTQDDMYVENRPVSVHMQVEDCPFILPLELIQETTPNFAYAEVDASELEMLAATTIEEADKNPSLYFEIILLILKIKNFPYTLTYIINELCS